MKTPDNSIISDSAPPENITTCEIQIPPTFDGFLDILKKEGLQIQQTNRTEWVVIGLIMTTRAQRTIANRYNVVIRTKGNRAVFHKLD